MDWLTRFLDQIRASLAAQGAAGRVAIAACAALVFVGAAWMVQWSGRPERVLLMSQPLSPEQQASINSHLRGIGADFELRDEKVYVQDADRPRLLASLQQARALPSKTSMSFASLMDDNNPFLARDDAQWRRERALESELSSVLTHFDGLVDARVFVQVPQRRRIGGDAGKASASVYVQSRPDTPLDKGLVASIADFVSGAVEGLSADAVKIVDAATGRSYHVPSKDDSTPFDVLDLRRQREEHYARKIADHLGFISGVLVGVHAELNLERKRVQDTKYGKPVPGIVSEETSNSNTSRSNGGASPGVRPNVARAVPGGGGGDTTSREESKTTFDDKRDERIEHTDYMPGDVRKLTASINVPRGYFAGIYKQQNPDAKEIKDADLEPIFKSETAKIRSQVKPLVAAADESQVEVGWFYDSVAAASGIAPGAAGPARAGGSALVYLRELGPQAGLGLLALLCVGAVVRMARRAQRALDLAAAPPMTTPAAATAGGATGAIPGGGLGAAASDESVVSGLSPEEQRVRKLVTQIGQMVKEDSQSAAALVEHWASDAR